MKSSSRLFFYLKRFNVFLITLFTASLLNAVPPSFGQTLPSFHYENTLVLTGGSVGQTRPVSVTFDPVQGEICITDVRQAALHVLNGFDIELFRTSTVAQLSYPQDGNIDQLGRLVCVDRTSSGLFSIKRLNVYGEPDSYTPESPNDQWNPQQLSISNDGHYLTLDPLLALLSKHDHKDGHLIWQRIIARPMSEDLYLGRPVQAPNGQIYIPGGNLHQILVLESDGSLISSFGEFGSAEGYFSFPVAVAFSPQGSLLVLDRMRHKIMVFDQNHHYVSEFGSLGAGPGQFYHPVAMASDAGGRVYIAQGFQGRVQVFNYTEPGLLP